MKRLLIEDFRECRERHLCYCFVRGKAIVPLPIKSSEVNALWEISTGVFFPGAPVSTLKASVLFVDIIH
ncbi:hypothetical protein E2C01_043654 [Portunus trituberculatus]|uniref:Uncharacterized protein n=1 Tax=Portunus trituberculatus TaxID=210409 RepID=A0A5B7FQ20_PORTR|nr:hypothetical protein [Portunus trituberculatus]